LGPNRAKFVRDIERKGRIRPNQLYGSGIRKIMDGKREGDSVTRHETGKGRT
jgi:hypothetical protein